MRPPAHRGLCLRPGGKAENRKRRKVSRIRKLECGLRPIGAYAYAPAGRRKIGKGVRFKVSEKRCQVSGVSFNAKSANEGSRAKV